MNKLKKPYNPRKKHAGKGESEGIKIISDKSKKGKGLLII
jgi:hypothetical protein